MADIPPMRFTFAPLPRRKERLPSRRARPPIKVMLLGDLDADIGVAELLEGSFLKGLQGLQPLLICSWPR